MAAISAWCAAASARGCKPVLQPGNSVSATWRARLDEHLGNYTVEGLRPARGEFLRRAACDLRRHASCGAVRLCPSAIRITDLYDALDEILDQLDDAG